MALIGGQPNQFGQTHLSAWGMIKALINNGLGSVPFSGVPVDGTSGTYAKFAGPGFQVIDVLTGIIYVNRSTTQFSPVWVPANAANANLGGLGQMGVAKMSYRFSVDGGAQSTITPTNSPTIPINAILLGAIIDTVTIPVGIGASIGVGVSAGLASPTVAIQAAAAISGSPWSTTGPKLSSAVTFAAFKKMTAAGRLTITISAADLTDGAFSINVPYMIGNA